MLVSDRRMWLVLIFAGSTVACARNPAPKGWLRTAKNAQSDPYGAWIVISRVGGASAESGEFLAFDRDSVFVLAPSREVRTVPRDSVAQAHIWFYDPETRNLAIWTALGAVSTISNGFILILTFPAWTIGGSIATAVHSRKPMRRVDRSGWDAARIYARFPAGLPANLPRTLPTKTSR